MRDGIGLFGDLESIGGNRHQCAVEPDVAWVPGCSFDGRVDPNKVVVVFWFLMIDVQMKSI